MPASPNTHVHPVTFAILPDGSDVTVGGISTGDLTRRFDTPLYVLDVETLRQMTACYQTALSSYPAPVTLLYAAKANLSMGLCSWMAQADLGLDVVSGGEMYTAIKAGFPMDRVLFNGNNKSRDELAMAIAHGVGRISVDNLHELTLIDTIAREQSKTVPILLRVTPGIECHTHDYIKTGHLDSKFGFNLSMLPSVLDRICRECRETVTLTGLHAHIGSQIFETRPYEDLAQTMLTLCHDIRQAYGITLTHLNLGGGLGIAYQASDDPPEVADYLTRMLTHLQTVAGQLNFPLPALYLEPGRSLIATAGVTLYTVGSLKTIPEIPKTYVAVDGGMGDNIRPALYGATYSAMVANKPQEPSSQVVTIAGKYCESGDILLKDFPAPASLAPGDRLMVFGTGAYNEAMASNYNRVPRPATVMVDNGEARLLVRRETNDDLIARDMPLDTPKHVPN